MKRNPNPTRTTNHTRGERRAAILADRAARRARRAMLARINPHGTDLAAIEDALTRAERRAWAATYRAEVA